jgi:hypothetical protein
MSVEPKPRQPLRGGLTGLFVLLATAGAALFASSCSSDSSRKATPASDAASRKVAANREVARREIAATDFDRSLFDDSSTTIDNKWEPYKPGTQWVWDGWSEDNGKRVRHRIVTTVTDMTKVIKGVRTVVGWERDFSGGKLIESELILLAQDKYGNVWHFGQYSETYDEEGEFVGGRAWFVGYLKGAKAGIHMRAEARPGAPSYSQGFAPPPYNWDDHAKVAKVGERTCVPVGCFKDVVVIDEFEPAKPGAHQLKYQAPGEGNVRVGWSGSDPEKEVVVLTKVRHLGPEAMAKVRAVVRAHEARADVYGLTPRAEPRGPRGQ